MLDLGSGPGRFLGRIGGRASRRVALDLSREMLNLVPEVWRSQGRTGRAPARILGDALHPPLAPGRFTGVVALGNPLGFAGEQADRLLAITEGLLAPGGLLTLEIAPSPGERSAYLARLPPTALVRLLRAPVRAVLNRLDREGYRPEPARRASEGEFRRFSADELLGRWHRAGWESVETMAVAPALGADPVRTASVRTDELAWERLLNLEEEIGRRPDRWAGAAAVLLCARRPAPDRTIK